MGDDVQIQTQDWDQLIVDQFNKYEDKILMVVPSDGRRKGTQNLGKEVKLWEDKPLPAAHFAVHKNWINTLGYLAPPYFWHFFVFKIVNNVLKRVSHVFLRLKIIFIEI